MAKEKILVVDDEFHIRDSIRLLLEKEGYRVEMAADGREGLELIKKGGFSAALVDLKMPGMDGLELMKRAQGIDPGLGFILLTGYPTLDTAKEATRLGAYDYIVKPFKIENLLQILSRCLKENQRS